MASHEYVVRTKGLTKEFRMGDEVLKALNGVDLDVRRGEYISIMGPSGSGKSTLFNAIGGLDLGKLKEAVEHEFLSLDEKEKSIRAALAKLETGFLRRLARLHYG